MGANRRDRRGAASRSNASDGNSTAFEPTTEIDENGVEYILKHPDYSGPKGKTLFDLAEDRQRELNKGKPGFTSNGEREAIEDVPIGPVGDGILYSISMAALHITLDVVVYSQYREDVIWSEILKRAGSALPIFFVLVYLTHVDIANRFPLLRNLLFMVGGIAAGCYLVHSGNTQGYFYVMKAAPPIATLWIWGAIEMSVQYAALSAAAVLAYSKWNGFTFF